MPLTYSLTSFSLQDGNGYAIAPQTVEPLSLTLGDRKVLRLDYARGGQEGFGPLWITSENIFFNPGLFSASARPLIGQPPAGWSLTMPFSDPGAPDNFAETDFVFFGSNPTQKNYRVTGEYTAPNLIVRLYFDCLSDIQNFITNDTLINSDRFDTTAVTTPGVYEGATTLGTYLFVVATGTGGGLFFDSTANKLTAPDGYFWPAGTTTITISGAVSGNGAYTIDSVAGNVANVNAGTPLSQTGHFTCIATSNIGPESHSFIFAAKDYSDPIRRELIAAGLAPNDAANTFTAQAIAYERGGNPQTGLSYIESTNITFSTNYTGTPGKVRVWVQDRAATSNTLPPASDAAYFQDITGTLTSPSLNAWEATYVMPPANAGGNYLFLVVWYDEALDVVNSHIFEVEEQPTGEQAETAYPDVQSKIEDYLNEYGDYVKAAIYSRLRLTMFLDKSSYNARTILGNFNANFKRWELRVMQGTTEIQRFNSESPGAAFTIANTLSNYSIQYDFRVEQAWAGVEIVFQWYFFFSDGAASDRIGYKQKVLGHDELKNLTTANIYDDSGSYAVPLENFCDNLAQICRVRTGSVGNNYAQMAVLVLPTLQEEETYSTGEILPPLTAPNLLDVDAQWSGGYAVAKIDIEGIRPDSIVILSKEITEDIEIGAQVNIQLIDQS